MEQPNVFKRLLFFLCSFIKVACICIISYMTSGLNSSLFRVCNKIMHLWSPVRTLFSPQRYMLLSENISMFRSGSNPSRLFKNWFEREKHWFVVPLIYAFIGWFLNVPWPSIRPAALAFLGDALNQLKDPARAFQTVFPMHV